MASLLKHAFFQDIRRKSGIDNLDEREQRVLAGGVLFVVCFLVFQLVLMPFWDSRSKVQRSIAKKKMELAKIISLQKEYNLLKAEAGGVEEKVIARAKDFTLFTFLDKQATTAQVKKQIKYMKPSTLESEEGLNQTMVEMKLQKVTLESLVHFIRLVESVENVVSINRISIQENGKDSGYLDAIMQIMTFELKGG